MSFCGTGCDLTLDMINYFQNDKSLKTNNFWVTTLYNYSLNQIPFSKDDEYKSLISKINQKTIQQFSKHVLDSSSSVEVIMNPESQSGK